jgi:glycerate dehydrogenase
MSRNNTSSDITWDEMANEWKKIKEIDGVDYEIIDYTDFRTSGKTLSERIPADADAIFGIWISAQYLFEDFFVTHPRLKYIGGLSHGYGDADFAMTRRHGVVITNTAYGDTTIAEYAFALLLALFHRVELHSDYVKNTKWWEPDPPRYMYAITPQIELAGKTFGVVGLGKIGLCAAKIARGFGMTALGNSRGKKTGPEYDGVEQVSLDEIYARSDIISVHAPATAQTAKLLDAAAFGKMKDGVVILNTSRGSLIDEDALYAALQGGKVSAAGLDVLAEEPPTKPNPLLTHPNVLATAHIAWLPKSSRMRQVTLAIKNYRAYLDGTPVSVINDERAY